MDSVERNGLSSLTSALDPLDAPDYDPIDHLNSLFAHPSTLSGVSPAALALDRHLTSLDSNISELVVAQSASNADCLDRISAAKADLAELFQNIDTVRARAMRTEETITAMTADIKKLDSTKRNLTLSMTMLKRLQMLTTAFEQLKSNSKNRQYRECSSLLSAVLELMAHFKSYRSISQIAALSRNVAELKAELLEQVCEDFEMAFIKDDIAPRKGMLSEACGVMDALGDNARQRLVTWYCNTQLREYRQVFRGNDEAGSLDNIARRYAWFKRMLKVYDDEHSGIFPPAWKVNEALASSFCEGTREDYKGILQRAMRKEGGKSLDVNLLLSALQETLEFELFLERRFSSERMSVDTMNSKDDRPLVFGKAISEAFEPYLSLWVDAQDKQLSRMIPKYKTQPLRPPDEDFSPSSSVLPSSIELFHFYRQTFAQCAKLSTGPNLLNLSKTFAKYLDEYADSVLSFYIHPPDKAAALPVEEIAVILNTAEYCHSTTKQLQERIKSRVDPPLPDQVDFEKQADGFLGVVSKVIALLVKRVEITLDPAWREMRNSPWSRMESVGDQSGYVSVLCNALTTAATSILSVISKDSWKRTFCDRLVDAVVAAFLTSLVACRPISSVGAEQMLLDAYVVKKSLEDLMVRQPAEDSPPAPPPQSYLKHVARATAKLDALMKTLQVSTNPTEGLVQAYLIHIADRKPENFRKVLELRGVRRNEQPQFMELFKAHVPAHEGLVENSPVMAQVNLNQPPGAALLGDGAQSVEKKFEMAGFGSAMLAAARDGVDRLREEGENVAGVGSGNNSTASLAQGNQEEEGRGEFGRLGRLFRREGGRGMGIGRFGSGAGRE